MESPSSVDFSDENILSTLWVQLLLQFSIYCFETFQMFSAWNEDMHVRFCYKEDFLTPNGPLTSEFDPTSPHSCLNQGTYLSNKHYHFKLPRKIVKNGLCIKKILDFDLRYIDPTWAPD